MLRVATAWRLLFAVLYGLAMLALPFAHAPIATRSAPDLAAFVLPDGSLPLLCTSGADKSAPGAPVQAHKCVACTLTAAPGLGAASCPDLTPPAPVVVTILAEPTRRIVVHEPSTTARPRAPPIA